MIRRKIAGAGIAKLMAATLGACGRQTGEGDNAAGQSKPTVIRTGEPIKADRTLLGTPMAERVAVIGLLNKRNGLTRDLTMKPGQALRIGAAIVRLRACEQTAPWENPQETGAFVQLDVQETRDKKWHRIFSGWLFKNRPDRNVVQHPIYDVWVKSCTMAWPETGPDTVKVSDSGASGKRSSASNAPASASGEPGTEPATAASNSAE
jgi:hypothetical protein